MEQKEGIREVTQDLYDALILDAWPRPAAIIDFGLDSPAHLGALQWAVKYDGVTIEQLDEALGNGEKLQGLISKTNPYRNATFRTAYDNMPAEPDESGDE